MKKNTDPVVSQFHELASRVLLAASLLFSFLVRLRLLGIPLERDEGEYAYAGQLLLKGIPPFRLAYTMKLPGTSFCYAAAMGLFGQDARGVHLGLLIANVATIILIYFFARDIFGPLAAGFSALAYSFLSASQSVYGLTAHATNFVVLFGVAGSWVLWSALRSGKPLTFFSSGLLLGMAFLMKQQGMFLPVLGVVASAISTFKRRPISWRETPLPPVLLAVGAALPFALTCLWLWATGDFGHFWLWTFRYARAYASEVDVRLAVELFRETLSGILKSQWPIWLLGFVGVLVVASSRERRREASYIFGFAGASFLCVCPGFYFREHYFVVLLPAVALLCGAGCEWILRAARGHHEGERTSAKSRARRAPPRGFSSRSRLWMVGAVIVLAGSFVVVALTSRDVWYFLTPNEFTIRAYDGTFFSEAFTVGDYLKKHSLPGQRVAILGSEPEILFYAGRLSATGFIYTYALMEPQPFARTMQHEMIREIEAAKPEFIVSVHSLFSWMPRPESCMDILSWGERYVAEHYTAVGLVAFSSSTQATHYWDEQALAAQPLSDSYIWILKRKPA